MTAPRSSDTRAVIAALAAARADGREVVPLLGGGLSAECGLPTASELVEYLTALHLYVEQRAFAPAGLVRAVGLDDRYARGVAAYVDDLNWPDPHQVTDGLWQWAEETKQGASGLERARPGAGPVGRTVRPGAGQGLRDAVGTILPDGIGQLRPGAVWEATGDWKDLLRRLTEFDRNHVEQLFTRLHRLPRPGLSHRFLAALVRILGVRRFLTINVDTLLEQALAAEGIAHRVFVLEEGRAYPDPRHFRDAVAVIKMHGGADRLLLDERLDHPVEPAVLNQFRDTFPPDGLLFAVGCGGRDRRLIDLIARGVLRCPTAGGAPHPTAQTRVVWLHREATPPDPVEGWIGRAAEAKTARDAAPVIAAGVNSPGHFLRHLYGELTSRHPAGTTGYRPHSEGPVLLDASNDQPIVYQSTSATTDPNAARVYRRADKRFTVFDGQYPPGPGEPSPTAPTASERLAQWVAARLERVPVWIDLEGEYTIPGVVGAIVDVCRRSDPELAPVVLPFEEPISEAALDKAADRIAEALRRGRYLLALDAFEAFPWPQTHHHGTSRAEADGRDEVELARLRLKSLSDLLQRVLARELGWSRVGLSVNTPRGRNRTGGIAPPARA